jgi:hypothetical protein
MIWKEIYILVRDVKKKSNKLIEKTSLSYDRVVYDFKISRYCFAFKNVYIYYLFNDLCVPAF